MLEGSRFHLYVIEARLRAKDALLALRNTYTQGNQLGDLTHRFAKFFSQNSQLCGLTLKSGKGVGV